MREEQHQRPVRELVDHLTQQVHRGGIRPVGIFDEDEERLAFEAPLDQGARGERDLALKLLGLDVGVDLSLQSEHVAEHRRDGSRLLLPRPESAEARGQLLSRDIQRVRRVNPVGIAEERPEDPIGRARSPAHGRPGQPAVSLESRHELDDEPGLARAGFADETDDLGLPSLHPVERTQQLIELVHAAHQRRRESQRSKPASRSGFGKRAEQTMDDNRLGLALEQ